MNRRVLVTGGASGLGAALVRQFEARGDRVLVTDVVPRPEGFDRLNQQRASYLKLDVTEQDDWEAALAWVRENWGGLDVLVNNAGIATGGRIDVAELDEWERVLEINLLGVVRGCRTFAPLFKQQGSGHVVNTASAAGLVHPPGMASYNAAKAGVVALSETLRWELGAHGVTVSVICPTFFRTNLAASLAGRDSLLGKIAERLIDRSDLDADDIAAEVMKGIEAGRYLILPDRNARKAFWAKRFAPLLYARDQRAFAGKIKAAGATQTTTDEKH